MEITYTWSITQIKVKDVVNVEGATLPATSQDVERVMATIHGDLA